MATVIRVLTAALLLTLAACGDSGESVEDTEGIVPADPGQPAATRVEPPPTTAAPPTSAPPPLSLITQPPNEELPTVTLPPTTADVPVPDPGGPVEQARADLASRLGVPIDQITVVRVGEVTWRNGALGCPQPGMAYTQALVNGMQILLEAGGQPYAYHSGGTGAPFFCADPEEPLEPGAGGFGDS